MNDATTIPNPAKGLVVYHNSTTLYGEGVYVNNGTAASPVWSLLQPINNQSGSSIVKSSYVGLPDATRTMKVGNIETRLRIDPVNNYLSWEMRRTVPVTASVTYHINRLS